MWAQHVVIMIDRQESVLIVLVPTMSYILVYVFLLQLVVLDNGQMMLEIVMMFLMIVKHLILQMVFVQAVLQVWHFSMEFVVQLVNFIRMVHVWLLKIMQLLKILMDVHYSLSLWVVLDVNKDLKKNLMH